MTSEGYQFYALNKHLQSTGLDMYLNKLLKNSAVANDLQ